MMDPSHEAALRAMAASAQAQVCLPAAFRAAARETRGRTARHLNGLATRLETGMDLEAALAEFGKSRSPRLAALIRAGARAGDLGSVLAEMSTFAVARRKMRSDWVLTLAYPAAITLITLLLATMICKTFVPSMQRTLGEYRVPLARPVQLTLVVVDNFVTMLWTLLVSVVAGFTLARIVLGKVRFGWFVTTIPLFGPPIFWTSTWEWLVILRQLVARDVPLPESLRLAAASVFAPNIAAASRGLADRIDAGESLEHVLRHTALLPASMAPLLGWGEAQHALLESLRLAADAMAERVRLRLMWLSLVLPPVLFVLIATLVGCVVASCLLPLMALIRSLS